MRRLRDEGYEVQVRAGYLLVSSVPYVNAQREVCLGRLISNLLVDVDGVAGRPDTHVVYFDGDHPCTREGVEIAQLRHQAEHRVLAEGVVSRRSFSCKPPEGYADYYAKMTRYIEIISAPAQAIQPGISAKTHAPAVAEDEEESVFCYLDTALSRAGIVAVADKLKGIKVGIVGLGGTGSYVLDLVAKTPAREIHLFDGDTQLAHNAFRSPGAPSIEELRTGPKKTDYLKRVYERMHKGIHSHPVYIGESNVGEVLDMDFVFACVDRGPVKDMLYAAMESRGIPFIDVGMGVSVQGTALVGMVRTTLSAGERRAHLRNRVSFNDAGDDDYRTNIQIADLNMLNATLAVIKWKKHYGFYDDAEREFTSIYSVNVNQLLSEDK